MWKLQRKFILWRKYDYYFTFTSSIQLKEYKTCKTKYVIHVYFFMQNCITLCPFNIQKFSHIGLNVLFLIRVILQLKKCFVLGVQLLTVQQVTDVTSVCHADHSEVFLHYKCRRMRSLILWSQMGLLYKVLILEILKSVIANCSEKTSALLSLCRPQTPYGLLSVWTWASMVASY